MRAIHPGEILFKEFLEPLKLSANRLAKHINVPTNRITEIINGKRNITADTALRFAIVFRTTPEFWMNLRSIFELQKFEEDYPGEFLKIKLIKDNLNDNL